MLKKFFTIITVALITSLIALLATFFIAENFFFDKILYGKSIIHGYVQDENSNLTHKYPLEFNNPFHYQRIKDLLAIHHPQGINSKILDSIAKNDSFKIAVIGDSFTYGSGIRNSQRFSILLEKKLNKIRPTKVYTFALPGDDFLHYYTNYKLVEQYVQPDLYIVAMVMNDFLVNVNSQYPSMKQNQEKLSQGCGDQTSDFTWEGTWEWSDIITELVYPASQNTTNLCMMKKAFSEFNQDKTLYFTLTPFNYRSTDIRMGSLGEIDKAGFKIGEAMLDYANLIYEVGGDVLMISPDSEIPWERINVSDKESHFSAESNAYIAKKLFEEIRLNPKWNF